MEIPCPGEAGTRVEPSTVPSSWELVMVWSSHNIAMAGSFSGSKATHELVWPCPSNLRKARFVLRDEEDVQLWDVLGGRGLVMDSDLTQTRARLEEALERVKVIHQTVTVDLPRVVEVSFLCSSLTP